MKGISKETEWFARFKMIVIAINGGLAISQFTMYKNHIVEL